MSCQKSRCSSSRAPLRLHGLLPCTSRIEGRAWHHTAELAHVICRAQPGPPLIYRDLAMRPSASGITPPEALLHPLPQRPAGHRSASRCGSPWNFLTLSTYSVGMLPMQPCVWIALPGRARVPPTHGRGDAALPVAGGVRQRLPITAPRSTRRWDRPFSLLMMKPISGR